MLKARKEEREEEDMSNVIEELIEKFALSQKEAEQYADLGFSKQ